MKSVHEQHMINLENRIKKEGAENIPEEDKILISFPGCENPSSDDKEVRVFIKQTASSQPGEQEETGENQAQKASV